MRSPFQTVAVVSGLVFLLARLSHGSAVIYVADFSGGRGVKIDGTSKSTLISGLNQPMAMSFAPDGNLYVAEQAGQRIARFTQAGKPLGKTFGTNRYYTGLAVGPDAQLYTNATDSTFLAGRVERFNP